jgi:DNA recombination protein RmuC
LANKILEEKTEKFTTLNQNNLKTILEPFQEKISELKTE